MIRQRGILVALTAFMAIAGCRQGLVVVLPSPDGTTGSVTVDDGTQSVVLDQPYAAGKISGGKVASTTSDAQEVQQIFGGALAAQPILPSHFRLYFVRDSDVLTAESKERYRGVFDDIKRRPVYEIEVIGHTDSVGDRAYNQQLSRKRAAALRQRLVRDGIERGSISIAGRGELDPAVKTGPQVSEPRNRRVEITVR
jgi:outer membrane protein OmpA-like peptidoglycan-associated protein